ncbi:MAG: response regulator [Bacteroidales bacterium]|jgi:two-component system alkaline phosphatase synthesis response regulator PhoP|nr:response regulator [Bacteroidales bacterium]
MAPQKTILLADDDPDYLFQLSFYLQKAGFRVLPAGSQKEAEKILEAEKPDLAIFDLMMENEDSGFILSHKMKKKYPEVPVIIATSVAAETGIPFGLENEDDRKWIKADCYLEKGIRPEQLLNEINKLLG